MYTKDARNVFESNITNLNFKGTCLVIFRKFSTAFTKSHDEPARRFRSTYSHRQVQFYAFLLLTLLLPSSMSVPLRGKRSSTDKTRTDDKPHWINPCPGVPNSPEETEKRSIQEDENTGSDADFINSIVLTAKIAIYQAEKFREDFVLKTFRSEFQAHHKTFKGNKYEWLRQDVNIPKDLGEKVSKEHLDSLELEGESVKIYGFLQRLAVAFEQIITDHRDQNSEFKEEFTVAEKHLNSILCELREIIPESKLSIFDNTNREIMAPEYRHMENVTHQHVRDWLIFRDYMNLVEYIIQVMEYFKTKTV